MLVADYSIGLLRIDLATLAVSRLGDPADGVVTGLDGIAWHGDGIVAIQNGVAPARVVSVALDSSLSRATSVRVLDRNTRIATEPTNGVIIGSELIYVANSQWDLRDDAGNPRPAARLSRPVLLALPLR